MKNLIGHTEGLCYFFDEELDWTYNNIGYCIPTCWIRVSTEIQFVTGNIDFTGGVYRRNNHTSVSYKWDFGDGTIENGTELAQSHIGGIRECTTTHNYSSEGNYTVKFTVTNDQGHNDVDVETVQIINDVESKYVTMSDLQYSYGETWGSVKYKKGDFKIRKKTQKGLSEPQVGEITIIEGREYAHLGKYTEDGTLEKVWDIPVSGDPIFVHIYKNNLQIFYEVVYTNDEGRFTCYFRPEEAGDHKLVVEYSGPYMDYCMSYSPDRDYKLGDYWYEKDFYVCEKLEQPQSPGFEAGLIITALLAVVYLLRLRGNRNP
jgi:archaellin